MGSNASDMEWENTARTVTEIEPKGLSDRHEGQRFPGDVFFSEEPYFETLGARRKIIVKQARTKYEVHLMKLWEIHERIERKDLNLRTGLLFRLTSRGRSDRFTVLEITGRDGPETIPRFNRTAAQKHLPVRFRDASNDHSRILVMHGLTMITDETRTVIPLWDPKIDPGAAMAAKIHVTALKLLITLRILPFSSLSFVNLYATMIWVKPENAKKMCDFISS